MYDEFLAVSTWGYRRFKSAVKWDLCHHNLSPKACTPFMVMAVSTEEFWGGVNIETLISLPNTSKGKSTPQTSVSQAVLDNVLGSFGTSELTTEFFLQTISGGWGTYY